MAPSHFSSSSLSRIHRVLQKLPLAIQWAETTIERAPDSEVGYRVLAAAAYAADDHKRLTKAREFLEERGGAHKRGNRSYHEFLTALEFVTSGESARGMVILHRLAAAGYPPASRKLLEIELPTDGSTRPPGRGPRS